MSDQKTLSEAFGLVRAELSRQDEKWGADRNQHDMIWLTILSEEFGETAQAILKKQPVETTEELVQVAAVSIAWLKNRLQNQKVSETTEQPAAYVIETKTERLARLGVELAGLVVKIWSPSWTLQNAENIMKNVTRIANEILQISESWTPSNE